VARRCAWWRVTIRATRRAFACGPWCGPYVYVRRQGKHTRVYLLSAHSCMRHAGDEISSPPPGGTPKRKCGHLLQWIDAPRATSVTPADGHPLGAGTKADHEDESVQARALMNLHHDHNNNKVGWTSGTSLQERRQAEAPLVRTCASTPSKSGVDARLTRTPRGADAGTALYAHGVSHYAAGGGVWRDVLPCRGRQSRRRRARRPRQTLSQRSVHRTGAACRPRPLVHSSTPSLCPVSLSRL